VRNGLVVMNDYLRGWKAERSHDRERSKCLGEGNQSLRGDLMMKSPNAVLQWNMWGTTVWTGTLKARSLGGINGCFMCYIQMLAVWRKIGMYRLHGPWLYSWLFLPHSGLCTCSSHCGLP
jgi:hypothetical protein